MKKQYIQFRCYHYRPNRASIQNHILQHKQISFFVFIVVVWLTTRREVYCFFLILFLYLFYVSRYMKYLYPYECEKRRLSTPGELQAAIDGNRREGRRGSYGTYAEMMQRSPSQMSPLSLVTAARPQVNGNSANHLHANNNHLPPHQALLPPTIPGKRCIMSWQLGFIAPKKRKIMNLFCG